MKKRTLITAVTMVCTTAMLAGAVMAAHPLTNATLVWEIKKPAETAAAKEVHFQSALLENALREYFGLEDGDVLTEDRMKQVKTIEFCTSVWQDGLVKIEGYEDKTAVKCIINGGALPDEDGTLYPSIDLERGGTVFNGIKSVLGYEALPVTVRTKYLEADDIADEWNRVKMNAFYTTKDIANPMLEPEAVEELLWRHPALAVDALTFLDPMAKSRELAELLRMGLEFGLVNEETILDGTVIELSKSGDIMNFPTAFKISCEDGLEIRHIQ